MTINDLLKNRYLSDIRVLSGHDRLDNAITGVNIVDSDDIHLWIVGGEMVLTNGFIFKDDPPKAMAAMIENLHNAGASALLIKVNRYIGEIPREAIRQAERLGFVILEAQKELKFHYVMQAIHTFEQEGAANEEVYAAFSNLLLENANRQAIIDKLSEYLSRHVLLTNAGKGQVLKSSGYRGVVPAFNSSALQVMQENEFSMPISDKKHNYGSLIVLCDRASMEGNKSSMRILVHAVNVLKFSFARDVSTKELEMRYADSFLHDLLFGKEALTDEEILHKCSIHGLHPYAATTAVTFKPAFEQDEPARQDTLMILCIYNLARERFPHTVLTAISDHSVLLVQGAGSKALEAFVGETVPLIKSRFGVELIAGIGPEVARPRQYAMSYAQSLRTMEIRRKLGEGPVYSLEGFETLAFLHAVCGIDEAEQLIRSTLEPLIIFDKENPGKELLVTLERIVSHEYNLKATSQAMYVHYNTLKYRYAKISEILQLDLSFFPNRIRVYIALTLYKLRESDTP